MFYGITASQRAQSSSGYAPQAVHFSGDVGSNGKCSIKLNALSCTDNGFLAWAGWFKTSWFPSTGVVWPYAWVVDSVTRGMPDFFRNGTTQWEFDVANASRSLAATIGLSDSLAFLNDNVWQHIIAACDVNQSSGNKKIKIYVDDVDAGSFSETQPAWSFDMNGKDFWMGDNGYGSSWTGDIADFSFWPGINLLTAGDIAEATRRLFIDAFGNPVDPSTAIATLGTPAIMCSGDATSFLTNSLGSNGSLSVPAGYDAPTNASSHP